MHARLLFNFCWNNRKCKQNFSWWKLNKHLVWLYFVSICVLFSKENFFKCATHNVWAILTFYITTPCINHQYVNVVLVVVVVGLWVFFQNVCLSLFLFTVKIYNCSLCNNIILPNTRGRERCTAWAFNDKNTFSKL